MNLSKTRYFCYPSNENKLYQCLLTSSTNQFLMVLEQMCVCLVFFSSIVNVTFITTQAKTAFIVGTCLAAKLGSWNRDHFC